MAGAATCCALPKVLSLGALHTNRAPPSAFKSLSEMTQYLLSAAASGRCWARLSVRHWRRCSRRVRHVELRAGGLAGLSPTDLACRLELMAPAQRHDRWMR